MSRLNRYPATEWLVRLYIAPGHSPSYFGRTMKYTMPRSFLLKLGRIRPGVVLVLVYMFVIFLGALILKLPIARQAPVDFVDALFTTASAITSTGLITVSTADTWNLFGKIVILVLIQLGGIGIMSLTTISFLGGARASLSVETLFFQEFAGSHKSANARELVKAIITLTFILEGIGAGMLFIDLVRYFPVEDAAGYAVFHAVSAFCNSGFSLFNTSYESLGADYYFLIVNAGLIILGGFGFLVLIELKNKYILRKTRGQRNSLQLRLVLLLSFALVFGGALFLWFTGDFDIPQALFHSVTTRTAGFNSVDVTRLGLPAICLTIVLMYIGASPGSTGGGVKTTSVATLAALAFQRLRGDTTVRLLHRSISTSLVIRAVAVAMIGIGAITATTFALIVFQTTDGVAHPNLFRDAIFEATSAVCTVGLSTGLTGQLTGASKITVSLAMVIGRLGLLTVAYGIAARSRREKLRYAEGNIMIG